MAHLLKKQVKQHMYPKGSRKNSIGFQNNLRKLFIEKQVKNP
jgi:hypothetical protein